MNSVWIQKYSGFDLKKLELLRLVIVYKTVHEVDQLAGERRFVMQLTESLYSESQPCAL